MADESGIWVPPGGSADPRREQPPPQEQQQPGGPQPEEISPEELAEQLRRLRVSDVVLSLLPTLAQLGYAKLDPEIRDLGEARVAIDALSALLPVLEGAVPEELIRDYRQLVMNLQLAYASAAEAPASEAAAARGSEPQAESAAEGEEARGSETESEGAAAASSGSEAGADAGGDEQDRADG